MTSVDYIQLHAQDSAAYVSLELAMEACIYKTFTDKNDILEFAKQRKRTLVSVIENNDEARIELPFWAIIELYLEEGPKRMKGHPDYQKFNIIYQQEGQTYKHNVIQAFVEDKLR